MGDFQETEMQKHIATVAAPAKDLILLPANLPTSVVGYEIRNDTKKIRHRSDSLQDRRLKGKS